MSSIWIHIPHRITSTINVRANVIILFTERIHAGELPNGGGILTHTIVIPIKPMHTVKFLAIVLVFL